MMMKYKLVTSIYLALAGFLFITCKFKPSIVIHPEKDGTVLYISGNLRMKVDPEHGARITSFTLNDREILYQGNLGLDNFGSTFLPSPQSFWVWPPPAIINTRPYKVVKTGDSFKYISQKDTVTGLIAAKEIMPDKYGNFIDVNYCFINKNDTVFAVAPWQNTRLMKGGLFFFETGEKTYTRKLFNPLPLEYNNGYLWYKDTTELPMDHQLSVNDGKGWLAYLWNDLLLIQEFEDIMPVEFAPEEGEVESYLSPEWPFIELECQGPYQLLQPGDTLSWRVRWHLLEVDEDIVGMPGNLELTLLVEYQINENGLINKKSKNVK